MTDPARDLFPGGGRTIVVLTAAGDLGSALVIDHPKLGFVVVFTPRGAEGPVEYRRESFRAAAMLARGLCLRSANRTRRLLARMGAR